MAVAGCEQGFRILQLLAETSKTKHWERPIKLEEFPPGIFSAPLELPLKMYVVHFDKVFINWIQTEFLCLLVSFIIK